MTDKVVEAVVDNAEVIEEVVEEAIETATNGNNKVVYIVAGVAIAGVCGYFAYKKFIKEKKTKTCKCETVVEETEVKEEAAE